MNSNIEIYQIYNSKLPEKLKTNNLKAQLMLNIWYSEFKLIYFNPVSFCKESV